MYRYFFILFRFNFINTVYEVDGAYSLYIGMYKTYLTHKFLCIMHCSVIYLKLFY